MNGKTLDISALLKSFQDYWRENSGMLPAPYGYTVSMAHLIFFAFSRRVLNRGAELVKSSPGNRSQLGGLGFGLGRPDTCLA
jgi:hypothetical protein